MQMHSKVTAYMLTNTPQTVPSPLHFLCTWSLCVQHIKSASLLRCCYTVLTPVPVL